MSQDAETGGSQIQVYHNPLLFYFLNILEFLYRNVLPVCVFVGVYNTCVLNILRSHKKVSDPLELELQTAISHCVGTET